MAASDSLRSRRSRSPAAAPSIPVFFIRFEISDNFSGALRARQPRVQNHTFSRKIYHFWTFQKIDPEISAKFLGIFCHQFLFFEKIKLNFINLMTLHSWPVLELCLGGIGAWLSVYRDTQTL